MEESQTEIDSVLYALGPISVFPLVQCIVYFFSYLPGSWQFLIYVFTGQEVTHRCAPPTNDSDIVIPELNASEDVVNTTLVQYGECSISVIQNVSGDVTKKEYGCVYGMQYENPRDFSFVSEFDLVCDVKLLGGLTQSVATLGYGIGCFILPWLSDLYGRKRTIFISNLLMLLSTLGVGLVAVTAVVELFPSTHRSVSSGFWSTLWWSICVGSLAPVAYFLRFESWRTFLLITCAANGLVLITIPILSEPLLWLVDKEKEDEAVKVIKRAARWNHRDSQAILNIFYGLQRRKNPLEKLDIDRELQSQIEDHRESPTRQRKQDGIAKESMMLKLEERGDSTPAMSSQVREESLGFKDLFTKRRLRINTLVTWFMWFIDAWTYNALYLTSAQMAGSLYVNVFLNAVAEGASCILMLLLLDRLGRKKCIAIFHVICGFGLIASGICFNFQESRVMQIVGTFFSLCGKVGIGGSFNSLFLYTPEIYPTSVRNRAIGTAMAVSTLGGMIAPFTNIMGEYAIWLPGAVFGTCSFLSVLLLRALPESKGRELPKTLSDLEA
ncbi:hypothetical protein BaRGS_00036105, partial [Batillaria attramentaria]